VIDEAFIDSVDRQAILAGAPHEAMDGILAWHWPVKKVDVAFFWGGGFGANPAGFRTGLGAFGRQGGGFGGGLGAGLGGGLDANSGGYGCLFGDAGAGAGLRGGRAAPAALLGLLTAALRAESARGSQGIGDLLGAGAGRRRRRRSAESAV
jgi:hypothetical protein